MEGQINLSDIEVTLTPLMIVLAVPISFAIQFIKALANRLEFFKAEEISKSLFPMLSIVLTCLVYMMAGVENWIIAGVVMGLAASGGYQAFNGSAKLVSKSKALTTAAALILICALLLIAGCSQIQMSPAYKQELYMSNVLVQSLNKDCQAGDPNACKQGLDESAKILQLLVDGVEGRTGGSTQ
jgi:hypothetical protein